MSKKGKIAAWNAEKGYGFIEPLRGGSRVFVHVTALTNRDRQPEIGEQITYRVSKDRQGRICAADAALGGDRPARQVRRQAIARSVIVSLLFLALVAASALVAATPRVVPIVYLVVSIITFIAYAIDKSAARRGRWRTSEGTLHLLALAGGWPGALVAQQILRHKSKKTAFRVVFWATVLINIAAFVWLHTAEGQRGLDRFYIAKAVSGEELRNGKAPRLNTQIM